MLAWSTGRSAVAETDRIVPISCNSLIAKNLLLSDLYSGFCIFSVRSAQTKSFLIRNLARPYQKNEVCTRPGFSRLGGNVRRRTLAHGLATAAVGDPVHLLALRAGALYIGKSEAGAVTTTQTDVARLRSLEHAAEFAAQNTIGTAHDHFRHFLRSLLPLSLAHENQIAGRVRRPRSGLAGEGMERIRSDSIALRRKFEH
jgi:hypothetical protein